MVPPRSSAGSAPLSALRPQRVTFRRNRIIVRIKPVAAPLVHVLTHLEQTEGIAVRLAHRFGTVLPALRKTGLLGRWGIAPRKCAFTRSSAGPILPLCFGRKSIDIPTHLGEPLAIVGRIEPAHAHHRLARTRKLRILPESWRRNPGGQQKRPILFVGDLKPRQRKRIETHAMDRTLIFLAACRAHEKRTSGYAREFGFVKTRETGLGQRCH